MMIGMFEGLNSLFCYSKLVSANYILELVKTDKRLHGYFL